MKKLITLLLIGFTFIGCEEDEVGTPNQNQQPPVVQLDCNCGKVLSSSGLYWSGPAGSMVTAPYTTTIQTNCDGERTFNLDERASGDVCEWELTLFGNDGGHPDF